MILQIDAGNTRIKWRLRDNGQTVMHGSGSHYSHDLFDKAHSFPVERIIISAVISSAARQALAARLHAQFAATVEFHDAHDVQCGVRSAYDRPHKLGADRWHAMIAAHATATAGQIIIDAGSALTVDYLDATGQHLGGYILPGRRLMMESLQLQTANVDFENRVGADMAPGHSTQDCVQSGLNWLYSALGARLEVDAQRHQLDQILLTGGDAASMQALGVPGEYSPDLVLDGLEIAAQEGVM